MFAMSYEGIYCSTVILLTSKITNSKQKEQNIIMKLAFYLQACTLHAILTNLKSYMPAAKAIKQFEYFQGQKPKHCFLLHGGVLCLFFAVSL